MRSLILLVCIACLLAIVGCIQKQVAVSTPANGMPRTDNSYVDLQPGWTLRIVMPLLKSGTDNRTVVAQEMNGNTMSVSIAAPDLIGYETAHYDVAGDKGGVQLKFASAEETKDGKTTPASAPTLPFELPHKREHVRLIYLVRVSKADHNMAIAAAKHTQTLDAFTKRLREDPSVCKSSAEVFCSWVPAGIAVRPDETRPIPHG